MLNMPLVKIDSIGAGTRLVRAHRTRTRDRPELGPDSAGARIGVCWPEGGARDGLGHRPQPRARPGQPGLLPRRRRQARPRARARRGRAPARRAARARRRGGSRRRDRAVRADAAERGGRPHPRQGLLARRLRAALLRRRRAAARRRLHRGRRRTATCSCPRGRRASPPSAARAPTSSTATTRRSTCRSCRPPTTRRSAGDGRCMVTRRLASGCEERVRRRVREVRRSSATTIRFTHAVRMQYYGQLNDIEIVSPHMELSRADDVARPDATPSRRPTADLRALGLARRSSATWSPRRS